MSNQLARLFFLACELRPQLPENTLLSQLKDWSSIIRAGAVHGLGGSSEALPGVSYQQLSSFYEAGIESGATPDINEFRSLLSGLIHSKVCSNEALSSIDKIRLAGKLDKWLSKDTGYTVDVSLDWDAEVETPPFTETGWFPIDKIHGNEGTAQGITTVLSRPGVGKTTAALAIALNWRRRDIGSVIMLQTELSPAMVLSKVKVMAEPGLFRTGVDRIVFGTRNCEQVMDEMIQNPDPDRLILFDSITGYAGQGDTPASRERFANLYTMLCQAKNTSRMAMAFTHVKRGTQLADIESAAGSSAIERFSDYLDFMSSDGSVGPDGTVEISVRSLKNRWGQVQNPVRFNFDYRTGEATPSTNTSDDWGEEV